MMRRGRALIAGPVLLLVACAVGWPAGTANAAAGSRPSAEVDCAFAGAHIKVLPGLAGAGNYNVLIEVKNAPFESCALPAYPTVDLFDTATGSYLLPTQSPEGPLGTGSTQAKPPAPMTLPPGAVATALLGGTEVPHDGAQTCPVFSSTVRLPGSSQPSHFDLPLPDCSGFTLGPFILGFNGVAPTGEVAGTAPACAPPKSPAGFGAAHVDVWKADRLADFAQFVAGGPRRYDMVLSPGRYRITSGPLRPRRTVVRAGRVSNIGRFGACGPAASPTTPRTVPSRGMAAMPTTTTPAKTSSSRAPGSPGVINTSSMAPCADNQLRISALGYGAAGGAVSEVIAFTNTSSEPCSLTGYPGVAALNERGLQVEQARRQLSAMLGGQYGGTQLETVPLEPGEPASATVEGSDVALGASACPSYFPSLLVTAPNETASVILTAVGMQGPDFAEHGFPGCSPLIVTPVVPGTIGSPPGMG